MKTESVSGQDVMVSYPENAERVVEDIPGSQLVTVRGGSHRGFSGPAGALLRWLNKPDSLGCYVVSSLIVDGVWPSPPLRYQPSGSSQMGLVHARSRIVAGTRGSGSRPRRIAS